MSKQCFGYVRVSTVKQGEGASLEAQREAIERYADQHNIAIIQWLEEKETAAKQGRPIFTAMIKDLYAKKADGVVMHKIDRSARNLRDWAAVGEMQDAGIDVHFAAESVDFASRGGRLTADIQAVIAADYIRNLREETIKGIQGRLKQGIYPFNAPTGYLNNGGGKPKTICPVKGPLVRKLFELYASGDHSFRSLMCTANEIGLTGPRGGPVGMTMIENMLSNPFYIGLIHMKRANKTYPAVHDALIKVETFERVAAVRAGRYVKKRVKFSHKFRRVFTCVHCNKGFIAERQRGHVYYRCHTYRCPSQTMREEYLESAVCSHLRRLSFGTHDIQKMEQKIRDWSSLDTDSRNQGLQAAKLKDITTRKEKLLDALIDGTIDKQTYETRHRQFLIAERQVIEEEGIARQKSTLKAQTAEIVELFKNPYFTYSIANNAEKRQFLEILCSNIRIEGRNVELTTDNWVLTTQNTLGVLFGPPVPETNRSGIELSKSVFNELHDVLNCPEASRFIQLCKDIKARNSGDEIPETETDDRYSESA